MGDIPEQRPNRRLVLCFDGTGNSFQGTETDTNIVKLYGLMDRRDPQQFHYYQPGIGTYSEHEDGGILQYWSALKASISKTIDQGVGAKFKDHVLAGYRFLMRYYEDGDDIYVFGFSRGAYTARFLSQMIFRVGLLSRGNEEMIHFAWKAFSDWLHVVGEDTPQDRERRAHMEKFQSTFCRENVQVLFLGLFDCVNSVGQFEMPLFSSTYKHMPLPPAKHIRHAVSISERRLKFKPALFSAELHQPSEDVKEVWFAGNHADVGGGWERVPGQPALLSDEPLQWMIDEVLNLPVQESIALTSKKYIRAEQTLEEKQAASAGFAMFRHTKSRKEIRRETMRPHDMLRFGGGVGFGAVCSWWIFEVLPFFSRLELEFGKWIPRHWPPNLGAARDLPDNAILHESVHRLHKAGVISSLPRLGGDGPPKLSGAATALYNFSTLNATANEQSTPGDDAARPSVHPSRKTSSGGSE